MSVFLLLLIAKESLVEILFAAIGVFVSWKIISRTPKTEATESKATLELAIPYPLQSAESFE